MYRKRETRIADAIREDSSKDKLYSYIVLFVISLAVGVMGYVLGGVVNSLSKHMENAVLSINSISLSIKSMEKDMNTMTQYIQSMDTSTNNISLDIKNVNKSISDMSLSIQHMDKNTKDMEDEIREMNKLNPMRVF